MKSGVLNLKKEKGYTSHDAVAVVRRLYQTKKVGHTGTLDPEAEGVLPILIGGAVKACDLIPEEEKIYLTRVRFGIATDTEDIWGNTVSESSARVGEASFRRALEEFPTEYYQIPPMMSAVKIGGKKLYEYAREGKTVERPARLCRVWRRELISFNQEEACLRVAVSRGTYIRTLLTDLCSHCGVIGTMSSLTREKSGIFTLENSVSLSLLEKMSEREREDILLPIQDLFQAYPLFLLPTFYDRLILNGCAVACQKLSLTVPSGTRLRLYEKDKFVALGEVREENGNRVLKKIKNFFD